MAIPDGKPATDFSAMNREWVRAVAAEAAEGGGGGGGLPPVTAADNGKILGVVNGAWGAMDAGGGGIPAPAITATFVISDYSDVALLETYIVEEIEGSYQQITLTEVTQETTVITGLVFPIGYSDYSIHWAFTPSCSDENDPYNVSVSDTVNCVDDGFGGVEVTDIKKPCSATFTFTKGS